MKKYKNFNRRYRNNRGVLAIAVISSYNGLVAAKSTVDEQYSNIQTNLQRRSGLNSEPR